MPNDKLTPAEVAALFALMAEAREIANVELKERYRLLAGRPGVPQAQRSQAGGVDDSEEAPLPPAHGRRLERGARRNLPPHVRHVPGPAAVHSMQLLAGLHRYLERSDLSLADVFRPDGEAPPVVKPQVEKPVATADLEVAIRSAYRSLAERRGGWVSLADLRPLLGAATRADVDAALVRLGGKVGVTLVPEDNQKTLTDEDRAAAVHVGGRDHHYLSIEDA